MQWETVMPITINCQNHYGFDPLIRLAYLSSAALGYTHQATY